MTYIKNILVSIDQLGNTISGGNPDNTISGRIGFFANHAFIYVKWYWLFLQMIVNATFYPLDGPCHCHQAYHNEEDEEYYHVKFLGLFVLSLITLFSCLIIISPIYVISFILRGIKMLFRQ